MKKIALCGNVVLPDEVMINGTVVIEGEKIAAVFANKDKLLEKGIAFCDYRSHFISPGLVDLHLHGALGKDIMDGDIESLQAIAGHQARCGVTGFLATTMSGPMEKTLKALHVVRRGRSLPLASEILGVHLEGPFLSLEKKGAQDPEFIKEINKEDLQQLIKATEGLITLITIAPEVGNNKSFIPTLKDNGFVVSIGHSDATYEEALESIELGASHATHFFNAWRKFLEREPGNIGAVFDSEHVTAEVIADGIHLHPCTLRLVVSRKGWNRVCLVTDSIKATGLGDGEYFMGNLEIVVRGNESRLKTTGELAGSVLTLNRAVKNIISYTRVTMSQGVNMASLNPARVIGLEDRIGSIQEGKLANLVVFDKEFNVIETIVRGRTVYKKESSRGTKRRGESYKSEKCGKIDKGM
jgi:N-acetylglucosamine-6-phosphate deacetylase